MCRSIAVCPSRRHYHASLSPEEREGVQAEWTNGDVPIIVATIAFGMGGCSWWGGCTGARGWWMGAGRLATQTLWQPAAGLRLPLALCCLPAAKIVGPANGRPCVLCAALPPSACAQASTRLMCGSCFTTRCPSRWRDTCRQAGRLPTPGQASLPAQGLLPPPHLPPAITNQLPCCPLLPPSGERACGARRPPLLLHPVLHLC
jgi:hypothetical protein